MKKVWLLLIALIVAIAMVACDSNDGDKDSESTSDSVTESTDNGNESESTTEDESTTESTDSAQAALDKLAGISTEIGNNFKIDCNVSCGVTMEGTGVSTNATLSGDASLIVTENSFSLVLNIPAADVVNFVVTFDSQTDAVYFTYEGESVAVMKVMDEWETVWADMLAFAEEYIKGLEGEMPDVDIPTLPELPDFSDPDNGFSLEDMLGQFGMTQEELLAIPGMQELIASLSALQPTEIFTSTTMTVDENGVTTITFAGISPKVTGMINSSLDLVAAIIGNMEDANVDAEAVRSAIAFMQGYMDLLSGEDAIRFTVVMDAEDRLTGFETALNIPAFKPEGADEALIPALNLSAKFSITYGGQEVTVPTITDPERQVPLSMFWDFIKGLISESDQPDDSEGSNFNPEIQEFYGHITELVYVNDSVSGIYFALDDGSQVCVYVPAKFADEIMTHKDHSVDVRYFIVDSGFQQGLYMSGFSCDEYPPVAISFNWGSYFEE